MFTGYLKIPDIDGESKRAEHEGEIDCFGCSWGVSQASSSSVGSGRTRGRASVADFTCSKYYDAASPYLALACMQGKSFDECVFTARKDSGDVHLDYLKVTMTNCVISSYNMATQGGEEDGSGLIGEQVSISCETINILYTVQADDHSAGDEHEIEFDIVAGA